MGTTRPDVCEKVAKGEKEGGKEVKAFYEAANGWMGESHIRCYVWADSITEARELAERAFRDKARKDGYPPLYSEKLTLTPLFTADDASFATEPSGSGWR